jgi:uncharacterized membrane protein YfcA
MFEAVALLVAAAAGSVASVAGFGIGSLLTPLLALRVDTKTAVAAVSIPHLVGTSIRFWFLRRQVDRAVLWRFGVTSAAGGLTGALLHAWASSRALAMLFGGLLVFAGGSQISGYAQRWRFHGSVAWIAGAASGFFGGLVGNQGGIRSAALLGFDLNRDQFVATATAIALMVDTARMPVYVVAERNQVAAIWPMVLAATVGVVAGTVGGGRLLTRIPARRFRQIVGILLLCLGLATLIRGSA